ncbi:MAG: heavy-metal-associated domain-containing protein [Flavobacteriales bacterium]
MLKYLFIFFIFINFSFKSTTTETSFKVSGNCEMCKQRIEKALKKVKGVKSADWNVQTHIVKVMYDAELTNVEKLHQAVANAGYDTDKAKSTDAKYKALPRCCQYNRTK